ncbi:ankyrin repeat-containing protein [Tieghemostelium lacteum]|uniref:Ankyrin repeat-containing protein n=1 Tax=Tieghemostelium lacteum TaxID=361077 RepID=A0A151Z2W1_TIELA|nr:ankyrin repeat-containing protein [Tieghemostelium lacteum]|eukprot:KYQ88296.1 ankyrin repeat-containing protein [Tieghemostelium lacteum]
MINKSLIDWSYSEVTHWLSTKKASESMVTSFRDCRINGKLLVNTFSLSPDNNNERSSVWNRFGISNQNDQNLINELKSLSSNQIRDIQSENACYYLFEISPSLLSQQDKIKNETLLIKYLKDLNFINIENNDINIKFSNVIPPMSIESFRTILQNCNIKVNINLLDNIYNKLEIHNPRKDTLSILINIISKNLKELSKDDTISYIFLDWSITNELPIDFVRDILDCDSSKIEMLDKLNMKSEYIELLKDYPEIVSDQQKKIQTEQYIESSITLLSNKQESTRSLLVNFHQCLLNSLQSLYRLNEQLSTYNEGGVEIQNSTGGLIASKVAAVIVDLFPGGLGSIIGGIISTIDKKLRSKKAQNVMLQFRTQQIFSETAQLFSIRIMTFYRDIILDKNFSVKIPLISMSTLDDFQDYLFAKSGNKITISGYEENKNRWSFLITLFSDQFFETLFNLKNIDYNTHSPQFICDSICNIIIPKLSTSPFLPIQNNNNSSNQTRINTIKSQQYFEFAMLAYLQQQNFTIIVHNYIRKWFPNITESSFQSNCTIVNYSKVSTITIEHENQLYISIGVKESTIDKTKYLLIKNTNIDGTEIDSYFFSLFDFVWKDHLEKSIQQFYQNHRDGTLNIIGYSTGGSISSILHLNLLSKKDTSSKKDKIYLWTFEEEQWTKSLTNNYNYNNNNSNNTMKIINSTEVTKEFNSSKIIYYTISNNDNCSQFRDINEYQYIINDTKTIIKSSVNSNIITYINSNCQPTEDFQHPNKDELDMLFDRVIMAKADDKVNMPESEMGYISPKHYVYESIASLPESNKAEWYNIVYMNMRLDQVNRNDGSLLNNYQNKNWKENDYLIPMKSWELLRGSIQCGNIIMVKYLMPFSNQYMQYIYQEMISGNLLWDTPFHAAIRYNQFDILEYLIKNDQIFTINGGVEIGPFIYLHNSNIDSISQIRYIALVFALSENHLISKTLVDKWQSNFEDGDHIQMLFLRDHTQLLEYLSDYKDQGDSIDYYKEKIDPIGPISKPNIGYTGNNVPNYSSSHYSLRLNLFSYLTPSPSSINSQSNLNKKVREGAVNILLSKTISKEVLKYYQDLIHQDSLIICKRIVNAYLCRSKYKKICKMAADFYNYFVELIDSENSYIMDIKKVIDYYIVTVNTTNNAKNPIWSEIFTDLKSILPWHEQFNASLKNIFDSWSLHKRRRIPELFIQISVFFKIYSTFCCKFDKYMDFLAEKKQACPIWVGVVLTSVNFRLNDYLLVLENLKQKTIKNGDEYTCILNSINSVQNVNQYVRDSVKRSESMNMVAHVQENLISKENIHLITPSRLYVSKGNVVLFDINGRTNASNLNYFLFNDCLLLVKESTDKKYHYKLILDLQQTYDNVVPYHDDDDPFTVGYREDGVSLEYNLIFPNQSEKELFLKNLPHYHLSTRKHITQQDTLYNILVEEIRNGNFKKCRELYESVFGQKSVISEYTQLYVYSLLKLNEKQLALQVSKQLKFDNSFLPTTMMDSFYIIGLLLASFKYYSKAQLIFELVWDEYEIWEPLVPHFPALISLVNIYRKTGLIDKALAIAKENQLRASKESINQYAEQQFASIVFEIQQKIKAQQQEFKEKMKIEFHQQIQNLNFEPTTIFSNNSQLKPLFENSKINLPLKYATDYKLTNPLSSLITNLEAVINKSKEILTINTKYQLESLRSHYSSYQLYKNKSSLFSKKINDKLIHFENLSNGSKGILNFGIYYDLYLDKATKDQIEFGSHSVKESKSSGLHFKKDPYSAGIEFAASQLQNLICESICPESNLIKIEREPGSFDYYLATKTIHGYNLANYSNDKNIINLIDHYNFSGLVISSFLTRPGDAKPDNFIIDIQLSPSDSSIIETVHLYGIDNDISFYNSTINSNNNRLHYHILNILYFFPQMNKPVHPTLIEKLTKKYQPEMILLEWIDKLLKQNELFNKLDQTTKDIYNLPIQFPGRTITEVYQTLLQISNLIQLNPSILLNTIFHHLYPGISSWYQLFKQKGDNLESIRELYEQVVSEKKSDSSNIKRQSSTQQKIQSISVSSKLVKKDGHTYKSSYNSPLSREINTWISSIDFRKFNPSEKESQDFFDKFIQVFSGTSLFGGNSVILANIKNKQYDQLLKHTATKLPVEISFSYSSSNNNNNINNNNTKILGIQKFSVQSPIEKGVTKFVTEDFQVADEEFPNLQKIDLEICLNSGCFGNLLDNHFNETLTKISNVEIKGLIIDFKPEVLWKFIRELKVDISVKIIRTMPMIYLTILMDNETNIVASTKKSILEYTIARPQLHLVTLELLKRILSINDQDKIKQIIPKHFNDNHDSIIHMVIDNHSEHSNRILNLLLQHPNYFHTIPHENQQNIDIFELSIEKQRYDITSLLLHSPDSNYKLSFKNRHGITSDYTITLILVSKYIVINSYTIGNENLAHQELYNLFQSKRALLDKVTKSNDYKTFKIIWKFFKDDNEFISHFNENGYHKLASNTDIQLLSKVYKLLNQPINLKEIVSGQFNSIGLTNERGNTILYEFLKIYQNTQEFNRMLTAIIDYHNSHKLNIHKTDRIDQMTPLHFAIISNMKEAIERIIPPLHNNFL